MNDNFIEHQFGHIIFVASGKGGVGKSTVAANLAVGIAKAGKRVGLLDADLHGPSQSEMFGHCEAPRAIDGMMIPAEKFGVKLMSAGMFGDKQKAFVWRGPLLRGILRQLIHETDWGELDTFIVDLPPGTGETLLCLMNYLKPTTSIIVSTPQSVSGSDTRRLMSAFRELNVDMSVVVENMSHFTCSCCGHANKVFQGNAGDSLASEFNIQNVIKIPMVSEISSSGDIGIPHILAQGISPVTEPMQNLICKFI